MHKPLTLLVALASSLLLAAPAHAQLAVTKDATGDGKFGSDFTKVTVDHADKRVRLNTRMVNKPNTNDELPHEMWHFVDTQGDRQPEFLVFVVVKNEVSDNPSVSVVRIDGWPPKKNPYQALFDGTAVDCDLQRSRVRKHGLLLRTVIGRGCLEIDGVTPQRLRVNTFGTMEWGDYTDIVKGHRKYGKWVTRG